MIFSNNYNPYIKKLFYKKIVIFALAMSLLFFSVFLSVKIDPWFALATIILLYYIKLELINLKKLYAGIASEIKVNKILDKAGVLYNKNIIINNREIDQIIYYPKLIILETKYGKGKIYDGNNIKIGKKNINKKDILQARKNCDIVNNILERNGYKEKFYPGLCYSFAYGDILYRDVYILNCRNLINFLNNKTNINKAKAFEIKKLIENI